jgi:hypothetical protein
MSGKHKEVIIHVADGKVSVKKGTKDVKEKKQSKKSHASANAPKPSHKFGTDKPKGFTGVPPNKDKKIDYRYNRNYGSSRPMQVSAYTQPMAPNRPYIPFTSYIASPYNNGLVPDQVDARSSQLKFNFETWKTLEAIEKSQKDMLTWYPELTKTILKEELRTLTKGTNALAFRQLTATLETLPTNNLSTQTSGLSSSEQHTSQQSSEYDPTGQHIEVGLEDDIGNLRLAD